MEGDTGSEQAVPTQNEIPAPDSGTTTGSTTQTSPDPWGGWDYKSFNGDFKAVPEHVRPVVEHVTSYAKQQALAEHKQALETVNAELAALKQQKAEQGGQLTARQRAELAELEKARANLKASEEQIKALSAERSALEARTNQAEYNARYVEAVGMIANARDYLIPSIGEAFLAKNAVFRDAETREEAFVWATRFYYEAPKHLRPESVEQAINMAVARFGGTEPADATSAAAVTTSPQGGGLQPNYNFSNPSFRRQAEANLPL